MRVAILLFLLGGGASTGGVGQASNGHKAKGIGRYLN